MKVAQEIDVDNVTIIINPQNKLEAKIPTTSSEVVIEEVPNVVPTHNVVVTLNGTARKITKLGKVNGTDWMVFQLDSPTPPPPPKPRIEKNIHLEFYDDVGVDSGDGMTFYHTGKIRVTTEDGSPFSPNGSSAYNAVSDIDLRAVLQGNTQDEPNVYPVINFNTMTYSLEVTYSETQTSSIFESVGSFGVYFSAEHEDAIYEYRINSVAVVQNTPTQPQPTNINTFLDYRCPDMSVENYAFTMESPINVTVTTSDVGNKIPQTVKFDVSVENETRTYSYSYSPSNTYDWNRISDFNDGADFYKTNYLRIHDARVEFTDGSSSIPSKFGDRCGLGSQPE